MLEFPIVKKYSLMQNIQLGDVLISATNKYYYVVEVAPEMISLKHIQGYTLFSCHPNFVNASFRRPTRKLVG
jgi:hypothetical protein